MTHCVPLRSFSSLPMRQTMTHLLYLLNWFRQICMVKFFSCSLLHHHSKLLSLFRSCNTAVCSGDLLFGHSQNVIYFLCCLHEKMSMCGETLPGTHARMLQHWTAMTNGIRASTCPGYRVMSPLGVHRFVCFTLCCLPSTATTADRLTLSQFCEGFHSHTKQGLTRGLVHAKTGPPT